MMVRALVRWGGERAELLAYLRDHEIEAMTERLKLVVTVPDLGDKVHE